MEVISGRRRNSLLYVYQDYIYYSDKRYSHIYRCSKRHSDKCKGLLIKENEIYVLETPHNHPSQPNIDEILNLKSEMFEMCKNNTMTNKEIFDSVSRKNPNVAAFMSYDSIRSALTREKKKNRPPLPTNVSDLDRMLQNYESTKLIFKGCVKSEDNKYSYIFTSDKLLTLLGKSSEIYIDGTFSIVPRTPNFAQLFSVHVRYMDKGIATLFILCEARTQSVYRSIWKNIVKLAPDLQHNLRVIMMDYEKASMNAVHEQFPDASIRGCWFHYCQAVLRKWKRLGLSKAPGKIISMAMTLALAPSHMFAEGLNLMQTIADEESENYPNMLVFMTYMRNTWLPISEKISVYRCPIRTNNLVESFHNIMSQKMQTIHPNLWVFLDNISKLITDLELTYDRLVNGLRVTRHRSLYNKHRNTRIIEAQYNLFSGNYSLVEFIQAFDKDNKDLLHTMPLHIDDNNENEICADFHEGGIVDTVPTAFIQSPNRHARRRRRIAGYNSKEHEDKRFVENCAESSTQEHNANTFETLAEQVVSCQINTDDSEDNIYQVPHDDYGYWNADDILEESAEEDAPFVSVNSIKLPIDKNNLYEEGKCIICLTEKSGIVFVPCGHLCCCKNCLEKLSHKKCPACNCTYNQFITTIIP